jgi:hypothetical protein
LAFAGDSTITSFVPRRIGDRGAAGPPVAPPRLPAVVVARRVVVAFAPVLLLRAVDFFVVVRAPDFVFVAAVRVVARRGVAVVVARSLISFSDISQSCYWSLPTAVRGAANS